MESVVIGGLDNVNDSISGVIVGGAYNAAHSDGMYGIVVGGEGNAVHAGTLLDEYDVGVATTRFSDR